VLPREDTEAGPHRDVVAHPGDRVVERERERSHLDRDHLVQRHPALERVLGRRVDLAVPELLDDHVQPVDLGDGAVPVDDDVHRPPFCASASSCAPARSVVDVST
jgi:hypothetical protein